MNYNALEGLVNNIVDSVLAAHDDGRHVSTHPHDRAYFDKVCPKCAKQAHVEATAKIHGASDPKNA